MYKSLLYFDAPADLRRGAEGVSRNLNVEYEFSTYDFQLYWDFKIQNFVPILFRTLFACALFCVENLH